ncbi:MAG: hypothetical protein KJZ92_10890 [Rhodocyclaceae bacterium]|nr:hypothetical protein [Rhodocyclaceae bacterium]
MNDANLPQAVYYLMLYALIVVIKIVKVFLLIKRSPNEHSWAHVTFVALEVVNTSAGVVILLVASVTKGWVGVVLIGYAMLLFVSSALDTLGPEINEKKRVVLNLLVVAFVISSTVFAFQFFIRGGSMEEATPAEASYSVAIPYVDNTLSRHLGAKRPGVVTVYNAKVAASSREAALEKAIALFESERGPSLFDPQAAKNDFNINILRSRIVVERLAVPPAATASAGASGASK